MYSRASLIAIGIVLPLVGVAAVALRFYVRLVLRRGSHDGFIGADDWMILTGCVFVCGLGANQIIATVAGGLDAPGGLGGHTESSANGDPIIDPGTWMVIRANYPQDIVEKIAYGVIKISILLFYRRIFGASEEFRRTCDAFLILFTAWTLAMFFASVFVCGVHPETLWSFSAKEKRFHKCVSTASLLLWFAITDVAGDFIIFAMPYAQIKKLNITVRDKIGISGIFMLGTLSLAAGIVRLYFVSEAFAVDFGLAGDISGHATKPWTWTTVESGVGLLAACLPPIAPLLRKAPSPISLGSSIRQKLSNRSHRMHLDSQGDPADGEDDLPLHKLEKDGQFTNHTIGSAGGADKRPKEDLDDPSLFSTMQSTTQDVAGDSFNRENGTFLTSATRPRDSENPLRQHSQV
ncbi:MAG: hypothetical protein M1831_000537 [Alyxoria varia]|nr:MAG: hypothetical protein M1831_000537 [Alyxoria varia]